MALQFENEIEIIEVMEGYLVTARPQETIIDQVDTGYKVQDQSIIIFEICPNWQNQSEKIECNIAKATYVKKEALWKVFWFMSDMKWHPYKPSPSVAHLKEFVTIIEEDKNGCFWG